MTDQNSLFRKESIERMQSPEKIDEYIRVLERCVEAIPADMVIHRLTGDGAKRELIALQWSADKKHVLNAINQVFEQDDVRQGRHE